MEKFFDSLPKTVLKPEIYKDLPDTPGIYIFSKDRPVYIGKAINLKRRVGSYFDMDLEPKTARMIAEATHLSFVRVTSELEALLLEAKLIRTFMPRYNIVAKDDKHPLYILITKERYPRIITVRKGDLKIIKALDVYGPFPSSRNVRSVLRMIRRVFPFSEHKLTKRGCLYSHIGLCKPCPSEIEMEKDGVIKSALRKEYLLNIRRIRTILDGKIEKVRDDLEREMKELSKEQKYEEALTLREQIKKLEYITREQTPVERFVENPNLYQDERDKETRQLKLILHKNGLKTGDLNRIECFDIAHLAGTNPTASMVTFIGAEADKKFYRHFKIYQGKGNSDVDSMREVIKRRLKHLDDWGKPDLIIVDGGKGQVGVFIRELETVGIPVVGLAKRFETLVIPEKINGTVKLKEYKLPRSSALNLVQRMRDEAHRFARRLHHKLVSGDLLKK
jgi:excinuclease ABC subunit C